MYATGWRRRGYRHNIYMFLVSIYILVSYPVRLYEHLVLSDYES